MGAPGYTPPPENLAPHAPMPGAPPYPPHEEHPPPPVGERMRHTRYRRALLAVLVWAAVEAIRLVSVSGLSLAAAGGAILITTGAASVGTWLVARRHGWPFWVLVLVAAPCFWVLRALLAITAPGAAS